MKRIDLPKTNNLVKKFYQITFIKNSNEYSEPEGIEITYGT